MRTHDLDVYLIENRYDQPKEYFRVLSDLAEPNLKDGEHLRSILDIGCAAGEFGFYLRKRFPRASLTGLDVVPELLEKAQRMVPDATLILGDVHDSSLIAPASQDVIFMCGVLSIFESFERVIENLVYWLRPDGCIYIFGLFNPHSADVYLQYRIPEIHSKAHRETGWNVFSELSIKSFIQSLSPAYQCKFTPFQLPFSMEPNESDPARTWTLDTKERGRVFVNGLAQLCPLQICKIWRS